MFAIYNHLQCYQRHDDKTFQKFPEISSSIEVVTVVVCVK